MKMLRRKEFRKNQLKKISPIRYRAKWESRFLSATITAFMIHVTSIESIASESENFQEQEQGQKKEKEKDPKITNEKATTDKNASSDRKQYTKNQNCKITKDCIYSNMNEFICNQNTIVVVSICITKDEFNSDPYCYTQNVAFINSTSKETNSVSYYYKNDSQAFINNARCIESKNKFFVELQSGNLGNCKICEWSDYFSESGRYLGSEQGIAGKTSFSTRLLRQKELQPIKEGKLLRNIEITTISN